MAFTIITLIAIAVIVLSVLIITFLPRITAPKANRQKTYRQRPPHTVNLLRTLAIFVILTVIYGIVLHRSEKNTPESGKGISTTGTTSGGEVREVKGEERGARVESRGMRSDQQEASFQKVFFKEIYARKTSISRKKNVEELTIWERAIKDTAYMVLSLAEKIELSSFDKIELSFQKKDIPALVIRLSIILYLTGLFIIVPIIIPKQKISLFSMSSITIILCLLISVSALFLRSFTYHRSFWSNVPLCKYAGTIFCFLAGLLSLLSAASFTSNAVNNNTISMLFRFLRYKSHFLIYPLITSSAVLYAPSFLVFISFVTLNGLSAVHMLGSIRKQV